MCLSSSDELDSQFPGTNGTLSVSHDSVFSPEKPKEPNIGDMAKSMERLPQGNKFKVQNNSALIILTYELTTVLKATCV